MFSKHPLVQKNKPNQFWLVFFTLTVFLLFEVYAHLRFGTPHYTHQEVLQTLLHPFQENTLQNSIIDVRLPRSLAAILVGAAFAVSGAMMQGVTRNAIADPGLLGINAGAGLALICGYAFSSHLHYQQILLLSLLGACLATLLVFALSYHPQKGLEQLRLVLSGAMIATLLTAIGQGITLYFNLSTAVIGWQAGGLTGTNWKMLQLIAPFIVIGLFLAQLFAQQLTILSLDETVAKGLGQQTKRMSFFFLTIVLVLSASAVALVGSLALIGLIIPHLVNIITGKNYQKLLPLTALSGACFLLFCDIIANHFLGIPLNAIASTVILPIFLFLMRKGTFYER